jgi:hypothetical protein
LHQKKNRKAVKIGGGFVVCRQKENTNEKKNAFFEEDSESESESKS